MIARRSTTTDPLDGTPQIVELERPAVVDTGRLRLMGFPGGAPRNLNVTALPLTLSTYENATAISLYQPAQKQRNLGAAYDSSGTLIAETQRAKPGRNWDPSPGELPPLDREPLRLEGRTFFAGRLASHFGHILLETLTRFWADLDYNAYDHFLTIPSHGVSGDSGRTSLFGKLVRTARLPYGKFTPALEQPILCESLDVPAAPFQVNAAADPRFLEVFDRIGVRVERRKYKRDLSELPARVYLSRSRLVANPKSADKRHAENEEDVEAMLAQRGFQTVHPQELQLHEQIAIARRAEVIAGCDGSALHLAIFSRPGVRMLALDTRTVRNQFLINQARGVDAVHVWAATEHVPNRMATWTIDLVRMNAALDLLLAEGA